VRNVIELERMMEDQIDSLGSAYAAIRDDIEIAEIDVRVC
jgi:hypothetical protein